MIWVNTVTINYERCKECGYCIYFCPKKTVLGQGGINKKGYQYAAVIHQEACTACGICALVCPEIAIQVDKD